MAFLTDQTLASGVTLQDLIHIVITGDTSQGNPAGSSYKATIEQVLSGFTGTTSYRTTSVPFSPFTADTRFTYYGVTISGNIDIEIPSPVSLDGFIFIIKDERGTAGSFRIRVTPATGLIDGNTYIDMNINYMSLTFVARNNNWWII